MRVLGLISGTSHDGIDSGLVDFEGGPDGSLNARVVAHDERAYHAILRQRLAAALPPATTTLAEVAQLDTLIGQAFAAVAQEILAEHGPVDLIVSHGQTMYHWVEDGAVRGTFQIGQPAWIAELTGCPVLSDVRIRDITAGGQGAPLASMLDALVLRGRGHTCGALNLGGIANLTVVRADSILAWDTGPANALIDAVVTDRRLHPRGYDEGGDIAASGTVDETLLATLLADPYFAAPPPKSTGKELFHLAYVTAALGLRSGEVADADLVATLTELTVRTVADAARAHDLQELFVSGGGVHNAAIIEGLTRVLPGVSIQRSSTLGVGPDEKEAVLMAVLGWLSWHSAPGTIATATGARGPRVLGALTPGQHQLRLPAPLPAPTSLQFLPAHGSAV